MARLFGFIHHRHRPAPPCPRNRGLKSLITASCPRSSRADGRHATVRVQSRFQVDSPNALLVLAECGAGVTALESRTVQLALERGSLVKLLGAWSLPKGGMYAVLPPGRHMAPRTRVFIDFYRDWLSRATPIGNC